MAELLDCMVNYFSFNGNSAGGPSRYYCYLVVAGPGPTDETGVATITTLAVHQADKPCDYCTNYFFAPKGGSEAALVRALLYLDAYHERHRLRKVVSPVRRAACQDLAGHDEDGQAVPEDWEAGGRDVSAQRRSNSDHEQRFEAPPGVHRPGRYGEPPGGPTPSGGV
jgi:hypothetical protein